MNKVSAMSAAALLWLASCTAPSGSDSRAERVGIADRTVWDRYGNEPEAAAMGQAATSEAQAIADMIAHHLDAIDGSRRIAETTVSPQVRDLAQRMIRVQSDQVEHMRELLTLWFDAGPSGEWDPMFADSATTASDNAYLTTMIAHHEHAISMYSSWVAAGVVQHDSLGLLAARIAQGQEGEIAYMHQLIGPV